MNIVTSSDSNYFHCLEVLAESVRKHYGKRVIVYDVGLTEQQRNSIDAEVISIEIAVDFRGYTDKATGAYIKTTHKPFCVKHYFENYSEPMIFVDADCMFMERVEEKGFDVGVTLRRPGRIDLSDYYGGILNAGVIFFNTKSSELVEEWIKRCQKENTTDQKELSEMLSETIDWKRYNKIYDWHGLKIKVFNAKKYNDVQLKNGKIFHYKGKRHTKEVYEQLLQAQKNGGDLYDLFNQLTGRKRKNAFKRFFDKILKKF
jgi:hypothetical protein